MKFNKITIFVIVTFLIIFISGTQVWADPNGNKGMFSLTDEQADKQAQEQLKEQEKQHNDTVVKSSDNYLSSLQVEGYTLTPEFDKQTLEYTIKEINNKEINIKATTSHNKATVNGIGNIKLEDGQKECRIEVSAENGTVRTYIIKIEKANTEIKANTEVENVEEKIEEIPVENIQNNASENGNLNVQNNNLYIIIAAIAVGILIIIFMLLKGKKKKYKRKH